LGRKALALNLGQEVEPRSNVTLGRLRMSAASHQVAHEQDSLLRQVTHTLPGVAPPVRWITMVMPWYKTQPGREGDLRQDDVRLMSVRVTGGRVGDRWTGRVAITFYLFPGGPMRYDGTARQ